MLISCSGHQPQKLNIHRRETYYTIPRHNWSEAAQGMHGWGETAFAVCLGSQRDSAWGRPSTEQYENHLPLPLIPFLESFFRSIILVWISAVTVRKDAAFQTESWASWGWFLPPALWEMGLNEPASAEHGQRSAVCWHSGGRGSLIDWGLSE